MSSYIRQKWFSMLRKSPFMNSLLPLKCFNNRQRVLNKNSTLIIFSRQSKTSSHAEKDKAPNKPKVTEETYEDVPDGLVSSNNGTLPVNHSNQPKTEDETYEEVSEHPNNDKLTTTSYQNVQKKPDDTHDAINEESGSINASHSTKIGENVVPGEYEDVPYTEDYEPLKRVVYENTKNSDDTKVYTGLGKEVRHSKVWDFVFADKILRLYHTNWMEDICFKMFLWRHLMYINKTGLLSFFLEIISVWLYCQYLTS